MNDTQLPICDTLGVTVFPAPHTAYTCHESEINLHVGKLRIILQNSPRIIRTPQVVASGDTIYLDIEATDHNLTTLSLKDGLVRLTPTNNFLPEIQMEAGQYAEVGSETISSPVPIGYTASTRSLVANMLFSREATLPVATLLGALLLVTLFIVFLSRQKEPRSKKSVGDNEPSDTKTREND